MSVESTQGKTKIISQKKTGSNRHWKNFIDKEYLGSHNLEKGEEMLLTIEKFNGEEKVKTQDGDKIKQVIYFKESVPKMIMNITNGDNISKLYGSHPDQWIGKQILIYATPVRAFGKTQDALRIRDVMPKISINATEYLSKLDQAKNLDELKAIFSGLPVTAQKNQEVVAKKDLLKTKLQ